MQKEIGWILKEKYHNKFTPQFNEDVRRLGKGEPLDYVIGFTEFLGCKIDLSKKPLIPRSETEYWTGEAVKSIKYQVLSSKYKKPVRVLDIFSGSGCIGISIMRHIPNSKVTFAEKDKKFVEQIKINRKLNFSSNKALAGKSWVIQSNVFSKVKGKFDYIFANPPYIPQRRPSRIRGKKSSMLAQHLKIQKSVLKYEPHVALFGGNDGFLYINKFLKDAKNYLNPDGRIYMEFDYIQKGGIEKSLKKYGYKNWEFHKDQYGKWRWVRIEN